MPPASRGSVSPPMSASSRESLSPGRSRTRAAAAPPQSRPPPAPVTGPRHVRRRFPAAMATGRRIGSDVRRSRKRRPGRKWRRDGGGDSGERGRERARRQPRGHRREHRGRRVAASPRAAPALLWPVHCRGGRGGPGPHRHQRAPLRPGGVHDQGEQGDPPAGTPALARAPGLRWAPGGPRGASSRGISVGGPSPGGGGPGGPQNLRTPAILRGFLKGPLRGPYGCASLWTLIPCGHGTEVLWSSWIGAVSIAQGAPWRAGERLLGKTSISREECRGDSLGILEGS